jgi:hypothetical protein
VEAALSDIILLGTEEHVRLAEKATRELVAGRHVHTHELVVSLRNFIREALDLAPIPKDLEIPMQGPTRIATSTAGKGKVDGERGDSGGRKDSQNESLAMGMGSLGVGLGTQMDSPDSHGGEPHGGKEAL